MGKQSALRRARHHSPKRADSQQAAAGAQIIQRGSQSNQKSASANSYGSSLNEKTVNLNKEGEISLKNEREEEPNGNFQQNQNEELTGRLSSGSETRVVSSEAGRQTDRQTGKQVDGQRTEQSHWDQGSETNMRLIGPPEGRRRWKLENFLKDLVKGVNAQI